MIIHPYTSQPVSANKKPTSPIQGKMVDVSMVNVEAEVLQGSLACPVLVHFWSPRCGACKQFIPLLEGLQVKYTKSWILAKINVDEQAQLAAQFRIQSVPSVVLVVKGRPVEAFMGAVPESQIVKVLDKAYQFYQDDSAEDEDDPIAAATAAFYEGDYARCATLLSQHLGATGSLLQSDGERLVLSYAFLGQKQQALGFMGILEEKDRLQKWLNYSDVWDMPIEALVENWLQNLSTQPHIKDRLVELFSLLGSEHKLVQEGRRKMSRILFS